MQMQNGEIKPVPLTKEEFFLKCLIKNSSALDFNYNIATKNHVVATNNHVVAINNRAVAANNHAVAPTAITSIPVMTAASFKYVTVFLIREWYIEIRCSLRWNFQNKIFHRAR